MAPDRWLVLSVRCPSEELAVELAEGLVASGGAAVEEAHGRLRSFFLPPADADAFVAAVSARLEAVAPGTPLDVRWEWQADEDWAAAWKRGLRPRRIGRRLIVAPSWTRPEARPGDIVIVLDPEMAFGTGEHATTRAALRLLQEAIRGGERVLDVGAGSAILSIAAARLGADDVHAAEINADALGNAAENIVRNGVTDRVRLEHARVDATFLAADPSRYDLILANLLSGVLRPLLPAFFDALRPGGRLILAGILEEEAEDMIVSAEATGLVLDIEDLEDEWWSGLLQRPRDPASA